MHLSTVSRKAEMLNLWNPSKHPKVDHLRLTRQKDTYVKNFIRTIAAAALLSGLVAGTAFAQGRIQPDTFGVITLTQENKADALPDIRGKDVLLVVGSTEFTQSHLSELQNLAVLHKDKLVVMVVDPQKVTDIGNLVANLISGPVQYPAVVYIGPVLHNLVGPMPDGAITAMSQRGLQGKAGMDTPQ